MKPERFHRTVLAALAAWAVASGGLMLLPQGAKVATVLNVLNAAASAVAAWGALYRARAELDSQRGWHLLAGAAALQCAYQLVPIVYLAGHGRLPPYPSFGDWLGLAVLPLLAAGMLLWPIERRTGSETWRTAVDGVLFGGAVFFVIWAVGLAEAMNASDATTLQRINILGGFALIVADLGVVVFLGLRSPSRLYGPLGWLAGFLVMGTAANTLQMLLGLRGRYYVGHPTDLLVLGAMTAFALAPWSPRTVRAAPWQEPVRDKGLLLVAVYVPTFAALITGTYLLSRPSLGDPVLAVLGMLLGTAAMMRQALTVRDYMSLSRTLESQVRERTHALQMSQNALARSQRLEAIGQMAGGIAHDFNNLTQVITGWADELRRALPPDHPDQEAVDEIVRAAERATSLTRQLLTFARRQPVEPREVQLPALMSEAEPLLRRLATSRVMLKLNLAPDAGPVFADPTQIEQLLSNLTVNARDAMPEGGTLTIEARNVLLDGVVDVDGPLPAGPYVRLTVTDTGTGMSDEVLSHVFEPFFTTKPAGKGTGLGLSTCYGIVNRAGGRILVESREGAGTRFTIELPRVAATRPAEARQRTSKEVEMPQ